MDELYHFNMLYDFYQGLLTQKQQNFFEMHYHQDMSLSEIAEIMDITPQGVSDLLKRTKKMLTHYEEKLHLLKRHENRRMIIERMQKEIEARYTHQGADMAPVSDMNELLKMLLNAEEF